MNITEADVEKLRQIINDPIWTNCYNKLEEMRRTYTREKIIEYLKEVS